MPPDVQSQKPRRILVVEDNSDVAEAIVEALRISGHEVRSASDGLAALYVLSEFSPEILLLDIGLPVMDGYELAERITEKKQDPAPIMIALSGYGQSFDIEKNRDARFCAHLVKPIRLDDLLSTLSTLSLD